MKEIDKIPTSKVKRASKIMGTGAKVGANYLKYYGNRLVKSKEDARKRLDEDNAEDIYNSLQELKGSALKMAQMMSMDKNVLPEAYVDKFSLAQFSVPPLSYPLVVKSFRKEMGKSPADLFDTFSKKAVHAASIGQVHKATIGAQTFAVKIQYPGVGDSIESDLALVKPMAKRLFKIKGKESDKYFKEVEQKLLEETNYTLELEQAQWLGEQCAHLSNLKFPSYYQNRSSERIICMDWMEGKHLSEFANENDSEDRSNLVGQTLWDFYMYQMHALQKFQADPHPGNFLVSEKDELIALDFGCIKSIPNEFYKAFFALMEPDITEDDKQFEQLLWELELISDKDSKDDKQLILSVFGQMLALLAQPFHNDRFDFSDPEYFTQIAAIGEKLSKDKQIKKLNTTRGSKHFIYVNRTFFGLYNLMHLLGANNIETRRFKQLLKAS